ncbi:MAG: OmpA family protein [Heliobacteriaceae bacterium]|jgi:flagellar motor protein MotB|nr:OmpA family protein [Heliobacteriaceae bacterium]
MRRILLIIILLFPCCASAETEYPDADRLEKIFKPVLPVQTVYHEVPRGLIISINEDYFFKGSSAKIKCSSLKTLDTIAKFLNKIPNDCVIEDHTQNNNSANSDWELSVMRSSNILDYLVQCGGVPSMKLFHLGYGDVMPLRDNVRTGGKVSGKRIDFVIIDYEAKR